MQFFKGNPSLVLDGSHNLMSIKAMLESLKPLIGSAKLRVVFSAMRNKLADGMLKLLVPYTSQFYLAPIRFPKGLSKIELEALARELKLRYTIHDNTINALDRATCEVESGELILATGSLYLVGEILRFQRGILPPPDDGRIDDQI